MDNEKYLKHSTGIAYLYRWMEEQREQGMPCEIEKGILKFSHLASQYFAIGVSKKPTKETKNPFLTLQASEADWIKMVSWERAIIRANDLHLYLVSAVVSGDGTEFPDFPAMAIALRFDHPDKLVSLKRHHQLDGREISQNSEGKVTINMHKPVFRLDLKFIAEKEDILSLDAKQVSISPEELLRRKIQRTNTLSAPVFQGDQVKSAIHEELKELLK